jgi:hypothetical protein
MGVRITRRPRFSSLRQKRETKVSLFFLQSENLKSKIGMAVPFRDALLNCRWLSQRLSTVKDPALAELGDAARRRILTAYRGFSRG